MKNQQTHLENIKTMEVSLTQIPYSLPPLLLTPPKSEKSGRQLDLISFQDVDHGCIDSKARRDHWDHLV